MSLDLDAVDHRPWPLPEGRWVMRQNWHDVLFAHWRVPLDALRRVVPEPLTIDAHRGACWVGVVPFHMTGVRPRGFPNVPGLSAFPEVNVRTYVRMGDRPGVWFFSLDADQRLAVTIARRWYHLPYFRAEMRVDLRDDDAVSYRSTRRDRRGAEARLVADYAPTGPVERAVHGTLEHWLTERYCLYTVDRAGRLLRGEVHHAPWPLQPARAQFGENTMAAAAGIECPDDPPLLHFAKRLDVAVWPFVRCG